MFLSVLNESLIFSNRGRLDKELLDKRNRKKRREKEVSVDSGVATDPLVRKILVKIVRYIHFQSVF